MRRGVCNTWNRNTTLRRMLQSNYQWKQYGKIKVMCTAQFRSVTRIFHTFPLSNKRSFEVHANLQPTYSRPYRELTRNSSAYNKKIPQKRYPWLLITFSEN